MVAGCCICLTIRRVQNLAHGAVQACKLVVGLGHRPAPAWPSQASCCLVEGNLPNPILLTGPHTVTGQRARSYFAVGMLGRLYDAMICSKIFYLQRCASGFAMGDPQLSRRWFCFVAFQEPQRAGLNGSGASREGFPVLRLHNPRRRPRQRVSRQDIHGSAPGREISASLDIDLEPFCIHKFGQDTAPGPQFFHLQPAQNFGRLHHVGHAF